MATKPLTIAVDIRDLKLAQTGTKTYLEEICREFKKIDDPATRFRFLDTSIPVYTGKKKLLRYVEQLRYLLWKQAMLPLKAFFTGCDVVFCTDNFVPLIHLGYKTIPVFHDAFFFESPQSYGKLWLWLYMRTALPAAKRSPFVVTPTAYAKKQISLYTGIANHKLVVVHEGPKTMEDEAPDSADTLLKSYNLTTNDYIFHVGALYKRKNLPALIHAFAKLKSEGYPRLKLVLAGSSPGSKIDDDSEQIMAAIENSNLQSEVILTGYLADIELKSLYQNALMYVFPSINEGFGIPVLEAFKFDLPVLVANNTSLPEVGGNAVLQFDPFDTEDIFQKIKMVVDDEELRRGMISKGHERLLQFSWRNAALQLVEIFKAV